MGYKQVAVGLLLIVALISVSILSMGGCGGEQGCDIERGVTGSGTCESLADKYQCDNFNFKVGFECFFGCFTPSGTCKLSGCQLGCENSDAAPPQPSPLPSPFPLPEPLPDPDSIVTEPVLLTPVNNEIIEQNRPDIGCPFHPTRGFGLMLIFDWTDSSSPNGIVGYHLFVIHNNAPLPLIDTFVQDSNFTFAECNSYVADPNLGDWIWTVQAEDNLGNLSNVGTGEFMFEPCTLDDGTPCSAIE